MITPQKQARRLLAKDAEELLKERYPDEEGWELHVDSISPPAGLETPDHAAALIRISKPKAGWPEVAVGPDGETGDEDDWERGEGTPPPGWEKRGDES